MKKALFILVLSLLLITCKDKEVLPLTVETVSAVVQTDGSVLLTGRIVADGGAPAADRGFGMGEEADPGVDEILIENPSINGKLFTSIRSGFKANTKYYFRAFARSGGVYSVGKIIMLDSIKSNPVVAPCTPVINTVNHGVGNPSENLLNIGASTSPISWDISTSAKGIFYKISFEKKPSTGIYTTVEDFKPSGKAVYILLGDGLSNYTILQGAKVYVNQITPNKWDIIVCEAPFVMFLKSKLTMRIQCID